MLGSHTAVAESAVIGITDDLKGTQPLSNKPPASFFACLICSGRDMRVCIFTIIMRVRFGFFIYSYNTRDFARKVCVTCALFFCALPAKPHFLLGELPLALVVLKNNAKKQHDEIVKVHITHLHTSYAQN